MSPISLHSPGTCRQQTGHLQTMHERKTNFKMFTFQRQTFSEINQAVLSTCKTTAKKYNSKQTTKKSVLTRGP